MLVACRGEQQAVVQDEQSALPISPVVDAAGIIPADAEAVLDTRLRDYWDEEETAIVVSTVDTLDGRSIEDYSREQFNTWGIGSGLTHRGVLILVAPLEREARIEVGCGLESVLTDDVAQAIMDEDMTPRFAAGDMVEGIEGGVDAIIGALAGSETRPGRGSPYCVDHMREAA